MRLAVVVLLVCCHRAGPPPAPTGTPEDLAAYLSTVAGADDTTRRHEVASWIVDEATWRTTLVPAFASLWEDYSRGYDEASAPLVARLAKHGTINARRHFAGDPRLTLAQARLRWALPTQYPSVVAELDGAPIDTVFIFDGSRWRVLAGVDELVLARVSALDPACADRVARAGAPDQCTSVSWMIVDAALRTDHDGFAHGCALAQNLCATPSP